MMLQNVVCMHGLAAEFFYDSDKVTPNHAMPPLSVHSLTPACAMAQELLDRRLEGTLALIIATPGLPLR